MYKGPCDLFELAHTTYVESKRNKTVTDDYCYLYDYVYHTKDHYIVRVDISREVADKMLQEAGSTSGTNMFLNKRFVIVSFSDKPGFGEQIDIIYKHDGNWTLNIIHRSR